MNDLIFGENRIKYFWLKSLKKQLVSLKDVERQVNEFDKGQIMKGIFYIYKISAGADRKSKLFFRPSVKSD